MCRSNYHQRRFQGWRETLLLEWKANCRRTKGPRGWPHPSRHQHGKALKLGRLLTRVVHVPPPCERVKYGVTRFPSKPVIRLEGVVPSLFPLSCLGRRAEAKRPPYLSLRLLIGTHDFRRLTLAAYAKYEFAGKHYTPKKECVNAILIDTHDNI